MFLDVRCPGCGRAYFRLGNPVCLTCIASFGPSVPLQIPGVAGTLAGASHEGNARRIVLAGKSEGRTAVFRQMAPLLTSLGKLQRWAMLCDLVTWVPSSPTNTHVRGYDQGEILASAVAKNLGLPASGMFRRRKGTAQMGLSRKQRLSGPELTLIKSPPGRVLLVDDVVTTGASMSVAAAGLRQNGAELVFAASLTTRLRGQMS